MPSPQISPLPRTMEYPNHLGTGLLGLFDIRRSLDRPAILLAAMLALISRTAPENPLRSPQRYHTFVPCQPQAFVLWLAVSCDDS